MHKSPAPSLLEKEAEDEAIDPYALGFQVI